MANTDDMPQTRSPSALFGHNEQAPSLPPGWGL
jgi:hypothetical protein